MSPCNNCEPPTSETNIYNYSLAADRVLQEPHTLTVDGEFTTDEIPAEGGLFLVALNGVIQTLDVDYTVTWTTGVVSIPAAVIGDVCLVIYVEA